MAEQNASNNGRQQDKQHAPIEHGDDDLDALMTEQTVERSQTDKLKQQDQMNSLPGEEDDLDAVLAENEARQLPPPENKQSERNEQPAEVDDDELEALLAEQEAGDW